MIGHGVRLYSIVIRSTISDWVFRNDCLLDTIWFSDKANFELHGYVNIENAEFHDEKPLQSDKTTVWAAFSSSGVIRPYLYEESWVTKTVTSERILQSKFIQELTKPGITLDRCIF